MSTGITFDCVVIEFFIELPRHRYVSGNHQLLYSYEPSTFTVCLEKLTFQVLIS